MGWQDTDETRCLLGDLQALGAAFWDVPFDEVEVRLYDGSEMSVGLSHPRRWLWKWSLDPTVWVYDMPGLVVILRLALDYFTVEVEAVEKRRLDRLAALGVFVPAPTTT